MYRSGASSLCTMKKAVEPTQIADYSNHKRSKVKFYVAKRSIVCFCVFFVFAFLFLSMHRLGNVLTIDRMQKLAAN